MRLQTVLAVILAFSCLPAAAEEEPAELAQLLNCGTVFSMRADDLREDGDADGALEAENMSDALLAQAEAVMGAAGMDGEAMQNRLNNAALMTGFRYGAGEDETLIAECLAAWDSP